MYEVAQVAGNKVEAACALQSLSSIMGISNSHHGGSHSSSGSKHSSNHHNNHRKSSFGHAEERDQLKKQQIYNRDLQKIRESYKRAKDAPLTSSSSGSGSSNGTNVHNSVGSGAGASTIRPITISEMNAYNAEKSNENANTSITLSNRNNNSLSGTNDSLIKTHTSNKKKEFYKVGEGYHKTDSCYYKTPDGGYHKLPPDSYHKMSEICYNKLPDGSFRRLDDLLQNGNQKSNDNATPNNQNSNQNKVRNQMIRFLKRSKSHTPATIKEMQKAKEREQRPNNINVTDRDRRMAVGGTANVHGANQSAANSNNRKVVVTMMENGGLPIVATSKSSSKRDHSTRDNKEHRSKDKVNETIVFYKKRAKKKNFLKK